MKYCTGIVPLTSLSIVLVVLGGCGPSTQTDDQAGGKGVVVPVKVVSAVQTEVAKTTQQPATVYPYFETEIRARASGYVSEVSVDIGDIVQAGDRLARLHVPELEKQRDTRTAQVALLAAEEQGAVAGIKLTAASVKSARAKLEQAKSERASVEASLAASQAEFDRTEDLVSRGSLQSRMLDEVRKKRDSELAAREAVLSAVLAAEAEVGVAEAGHAVAEARLKTAQSQTEVARRQLEELQVSLDFADVTAPFDGIVSQRHVNLGDLIQGHVQEGTTPLFHLSQVDRVRIQIPVPEIEAPFVQAGDTVRLTLPSFASEPAIETTVTRRTGSLDPNTRTMIVEAEIDNPEGRLLPGMFGQATIERKTKGVATMLPSRAVRFDESGRAYVYLLDASNRVQIADVTTGMDTGTEIDILTGLRPGDQVIGPHLKRFRAGQQVEPL